MKKVLWRFTMLGAMAMLLGGCVVGQSLDMEYEANEISDVGKGVQVVVGVSDDRPFVTNGDKPNHFIGQYRSGFGIPYDVSTDGEEPLATLVRRDLRKDMESMGFATGGSGGQRALDLTIRNWDFDAYQNGEFKYDVLVEIKDGSGNTLSSTTVADEVQVQGTFWTGGKGGFEKAMPGLYRDVIRALVRDNSDALSALTR